MTEYRNPPTVVVVTVQIAPTGDLLMIRRALADGYGKLALPGGYQTHGETWRGAGAREVEEETGIAIDRKSLILDDVITVESGINLIFCTCPIVIHDQVPRAADGESLEVVVVDRRPALEDIAFPTHAQAVDRFFTGRLPIQDAPGALPRDITRFKKFASTVD